MNSRKIYFLSIFGLAILLYLSIDKPFFSLRNDSLLLKWIKGDLSESDSLLFYNIRINSTLSAFFSGAALALAGGLMQTIFKNPLAGPYVLGISSGAAFFVSLFHVCSSWIFFREVSTIGQTGAAFLGATIVLMATTFIAKKLKDNSVTLIIGLLLSYVFSGATSIVLALGNFQELQSYLFWTFGGFDRLSSDVQAFYCSAILLFLSFSLVLCKRLDFLLMGEEFCETNGIDINRLNTVIIFLVGALTSLVTSFCGPIGFIGLIAPHLAKNVLGMSRHSTVLPLAFIMGGTFAVLINLISSMPMGALVPVNGLLGVISGPIIVVFMLRARRNF